MYRYRYTWTKSVAPCLPRMPAPLSARPARLMRVAPLAWLLCGVMVLAPLAVAFLDEFALPTARTVVARDPAVVSSVILHATAGVLAVEVAFPTETNPMSWPWRATMAVDDTRRRLIYIDGTSITLLSLTTGRVMRAINVSGDAFSFDARNGRAFVTRQSNRTITTLNTLP